MAYPPYSGMDRYVPPDGPSYGGMMFPYTVQPGACAANSRLPEPRGAFDALPPRESELHRLKLELQHEESSALELRHRLTQGGAGLPLTQPPYSSGGKVAWWSWDAGKAAPCGGKGDGKAGGKDGWWARDPGKGPPCSGGCGGRAGSNDAWWTWDPGKGLPCGGKDEGKACSKDAWWTWAPQKGIPSGGKIDGKAGGKDGELTLGPYRVPPYAGKDGFKGGQSPLGPRQPPPWRDPEMSSLRSSQPQTQSQPMPPPNVGALGTQEQASRRHKEVAERCRELYLRGRLEGFEVLRPESVFPTAAARSASSSQRLNMVREVTDSETTLRVRVLAAYNLRNRDTGMFGDVSDPYVIVHIGQQEKRTPAIDNNLNPVWDKGNEFSFHIGEQDGTLELEVRNSNIMMDNSLGRTSVALWSLQQGAWQHRRERLQDGVSGELEFEVFFDSPNVPLPVRAQLPTSVGDIANTAAPTTRSLVPAEQTGLVHVRILSGRKLKNRESGIMADVSSPYVIMKVGETQKRTPAIENTSNPVWDRENNFSLPVYPQDNSLELTVVNAISDSKLGRLTVDLYSLPSDGEWQLRKERLKEAGSKKSEIEYEIRFDRAENAVGFENDQASRQELERLYAEFHRRMTGDVATVAKTPSTYNILPITNSSNPFASERGRLQEQERVGASGLSQAELAAADAAARGWTAQLSGKSRDEPPPIDMLHVRL